ncbi:MAG TPA: hypothetical protein DDW23_02815 [Planctomycetes bacterium]|nr:hypothetical protein [Planctomycetota bacterium]
MSPVIDFLKKPRGRTTVVLALFLFLGVGPCGWFRGSGSQVGVLGAEVREGPLTISVVQRGNLSAKNSVKIKSEVEGQAAILYLLEEGSFVQKGELVAELDTSGLLDRVVAQDISVQNAQATLTKAEQDYLIQKSQNTSDIAAALQKLDFSQTDMEKYLKGDWPQQLQESEEAIVLATEEQAQARDRLEWSQKLYEKGFLTRTELEADELQFNRNTIRLEQANRQKSLLIQFDNPKETARMEAAVGEAERELDRVKLQASARLVDDEASVRTSKAKLKLEAEKLTKMKQQVAKAKLYAPEEGMVVYSRTESRRGEGDPIQEGTSVRERQEIMTIPRAGGMMAEVSLHESVLEKVKVGQPCEITVDAFPGATLSGTVDFVALLPDKGSWWANPNKRVFRALVSLSDSEDELRPGMSCSVEIVIAEIANTVYMPLQAVFQQDGETICFVGGNPRSVSLGQSNDQWVEVSEGVEPGEIVSLSPPAGFLTEGGGGRAETSDSEGNSLPLESTADSRKGQGVTSQNG